MANELKLDVKVTGAQQGAQQIDQVAKATEKTTQATEKNTAATKKGAESAKSLGSALSDLGGRNNSAKDLLEGLNTAASGGANAFFGLAKSAKAAWSIFTAGPVGAIVSVLGLAASAAIAFGGNLLKAKKSAEELAAEVETVRKKAEELAAARSNSFADQLKAVGKEAEEATRKLEQHANARERISDAVLGRQLQAIQADQNLTPEQKTQASEAARKAREKEKADNEINDQRAKLKVEQNELAKQQEAALEIERAASESRAKANRLKQDQTRLGQIPEELVETNERIRAAGGGDFQVEQGTRGLRDERRAVASRLRDGALAKAEAEATAAEKASTDARQKIAPQFDKVRQMQQVIDVEVATRQRVAQVESTKGPVTPRLKQELLQATANDIFNNGNNQSRDGSGGFINGQFVGAPKRTGPATINGQPVASSSSGQNLINGQPVSASPSQNRINRGADFDQAAQEIKSQEPVDPAPAADAVKVVAQAMQSKTEEGNANIQQAAATIRESAAKVPAPANLDPLMTAQTEYHGVVVNRFAQTDQKIAEMARTIQLFKQQIQSQQASR